MSMKRVMTTLARGKRCLRTPSQEKPAKPTTVAETNPNAMFIHYPGFVEKVREMLRRRHRDPAAWMVLPFPVVYRKADE